MAEAVVTPEKLQHIPFHRRFAGHVHIQLAGANHKPAENVEIGFGFVGGRFLEPGIDQVASAVHEKTVVSQAAFYKTRSQVASFSSRSAPGEAEGDVVIAGDIGDAGVYQGEVVSEARVEVHVFVGHQQVTLFAESAHGTGV